MKLKQILNLSRYALSRTPEGALSSIYKSVKNAFKQRVKTFAKHDALDVIPKNLQNLPSGNMSKTKLVNAIGEITNFMQGDIGTYAQYRKHQDEKISKVERLLGIKFEDDADFENYGRFMGAMQERYGENWKNKASGQAMQLYAEGKRLNLNPMQFVKNYEYWMDKLDKLEEATPLHAKNLKPSSYIRQLHLPRIKDWDPDE